MPLTPFIGLSVLVHLVIIFYYRFFGKNDTKGMPLKKVAVSGKALRLTTFCIVASIFLIVIINASILVTASLFDKHSSVAFVDHMAGEMINSIAVAESNYPIVTNNPALNNSGGLAVVRSFYH